MPDGRRTKILWMTKERIGEALRLKGVLSGSDDVSISKTLPGVQDYPSIVSLPAPGCWTLSLATASRSLGWITIRAFQT